MNTNSRMRAWLFIATLMVSFSNISIAEIVVKTFHDANNNGVFDTGETLITGLSVHAYDDKANMYGFMDDGAGTFKLNIVPSRMRIQVTGYNESLREGVAGPTSVFFSEDGNTFYVPVRKERQFDSSNTFVLVPCFEKGSAGNKVNSPAFVAFPYDVDGVSQEYGGTAPNPRMDATIAELGSTWGVGYQSTKSRAFISTVLKRHVDLGPEGPGGIYVLDYNSNPNDPELSSFNLEGYKPAVGPTIELGALNRNIVDGLIGDNDIYALTSTDELIGRASFDVDAFDKVGQLAYGDIDLSEDEKQLWMVNLNQRSLISLDVTSDEINVTANKLKHYIIDSLNGLPSVDFRFRRNINAGSNKNNFGAESFTDPNKIAWDRNKYSDTLSKVEYKKFEVENSMNKTEGTTLPPLYHNWRKGRNIFYNIPIPKEEVYTVTLHFAEPNNYEPGDRLFDVIAEDSLVMDNFDVSAAVGKKKAMTYTFTVKATGPTLDLHFKGEFGKKVREAFVSGIEIIGESLVKSGNLRPWGLAFHSGRGYIGLVNDAAITQARDHLHGWVMSFDPNNMAAPLKEEVAFPLAYPRERTSNADYEDPQALRTAAWLPWVENWEMTHIPLDDHKNIDGGLLCSYPQPQISDINFTEDGSMVINLMDRWAHQTGYMNYSTITPNRTYIIGYASGDIVKAFKKDTSYILEEWNNDDGVFYTDDDGPSYAGEFFYEDEYQAKDFAHHGELITGGAAVLYGTNEVIATVHNPIETTLEHFDFNGLFTQGVHYYSTLDGAKTHAYLFVDQFNIGKANGLGDIEFALGAPSGEVGNYLWCDANANGIQDPIEFGIRGVELVLHDKENSLQVIGSTMSDDTGHYVFQNLLPNHCYEIRIDLSQLEALGYSGLIAPPLMGMDTTIDSNGDGDMLPGFAVAMFCTDALANNQHHIDFGFGGPRALDAMKSECEDPMTGCATFTMSAVAACVDTTGLNVVRFYPTFNDADSMLNEITAATIDVCDVDTTLFARVNVPGDVTCASIAQVTLTELNGGSVPQAFTTSVCPAPTFDAAAYLTSQGINGMSATFYSDPARMNMIMNPVPTPSYPTVVYFDATVGMAACSVIGSITINDIPSAMISAGNSTSSCGLQCIDLTTLGASFNANGSGASMAQWTSSGTGIFMDDNTFAGARFYCPDSMDMQNGSVTLTLAVTDDPCGRPINDAVTITIFTSDPRFIGDGATDTILCIDPFVDDQINNDTFPRCRLVANCGDTITATVIDYQTVVGNCFDIVKLIIRTQRVHYNKVDYYCTDTIRVASLDFNNFICPPQRDSVYCHTGYLKDENGHPSPYETGIPMADTVPLWPQPNSKCDILILYKDVEFTGDCPMTIHRTWYVKNACSGRFDTCEQWLMIFDTIGPDIKKDFGKAVIAEPGTFAGMDTVILVPTSSHDCAAHSYVPPVWVTDTCHDVKLVKATVPGITTVNLTYNANTGKWESHQQIKIPRTEAPIPLIYEAFDLCHNVTRDTCYFFVKDFTKPVTICDKGINVTISDTTVWLSADVFDEGSWDNCGISLLLARRADWATACGMNLCDSIIPYCTTEHHDTLWCSVLEQDKHVNPIAAHYAKTLQWLCEDEQECSDFIIGGWWYDLIKKATLECIDHPYPVNDQYLKQIFNDPSLECFEDSLNIGDLCTKLGFDFVSNLPQFAAPLFSQSSETAFDIVSQIGGGWSKEVPFCCTDACQNVMVEVLAMDYWCNWSKCWTTVFVEDKTPPVVVCDLFDINLSCTSYKQFYEYAVLDAQQGDFTALDSLLGGYDQVQYDQYHNTPAKTPFNFYNVRCDSVLVKKDSLIYDEHLGYQWVSYQRYEKVYDTLEVPRYRGQIADDCGLVSIEKTPWINLDACGNGFIKRVFKFVGQCQINGPDHKVDTLTKYQTIWIQSDCPITKSMFTVPDDIILYDCGIEYDLSGNGNAGGAAHPDNTGWSEYIFDNDCRQVGIGYYDKVFKIVGGTEGCYKIVRTWCFADWCTLDEYPKEAQWWFNPKYEGKYFSCVQKILLLDTISPVCTINLPDTIEASGCLYNLATEVQVEDACGVLDYYWELFDKNDLRVGHATGELNSAVSNSISVSKSNLQPGAYTLKAV
ncbi:MAG: hypothetical protein HKN76_13820 [Saprospiraceae bacterium]|nr:hypothetical protein [Saprospiraceae bacterium]